MNPLSTAGPLIVVVMASALTIGATACDGDGGEATVAPSPAAGATPTATVEAEPTPEPTPTAVPEPTPVPETGGMDGFRAFAQQIEQALANRDIEFFTDRARLSDYTCPSEPADLIDPRCAGQPGGTVINGVWMGIWRSEGFLMAPDSFGRDITGYLSALAEPTLYAIGDKSGHTSDFFGLKNAFFAVIASSDDPANTMRVFNFEFSPERGGWRTAMVIDVGAALAEEWLSGDCVDCFDHWESWEGAP